MEETKIIEEVNGEIVTEVYEEVSKNNGTLVKLGVAGLGLAAVVGAVIYFKKRKARKEAEAIEAVEESSNESEVDE